MAQVPQAQSAEVPTREQIQQVWLVNIKEYLFFAAFILLHNCFTNFYAKHSRLLLSFCCEQQELEDNEKLIKATLENMNAGKLQACAG